MSTTIHTFTTSSGRTFTRKSKTRTYVACLVLTQTVKAAEKALGWAREEIAEYTEDEIAAGEAVNALSTIEELQTVISSGKFEQEVVSWHQSLEHADKAAGSLAKRYPGYTVDVETTIVVTK